MQDTLPLNLLKLDSRLQEILGLVDLFLIDEVKTPQTKVAEAVDRFITDYSSDKSGPCALFGANCKATWKRNEGFYGTHIFRVHELSGTLSNYRGSGKGLLGTVCEAILQFRVDSRCKVDWREHGEQLRRALLRYLSFRGHDFDTTPAAAETKTRKRKRKADPKAAKRQEQRKTRHEIEKTIHDEWDREDWGGRYRDYVEWKNQNLPKGWSELTHRMVERAVENVNRRERDKK